MMEVYAGFLSQTDYNVGRVLDAIAQLGQLDNTLVIYIVGDNGASQEGSMQGSLNEIAGINGIEESYQQVLAHKDEIGTWKTHNHYPIGWAHAMDTPFKYAKGYASHYGGTRNGMVISWPARIKDRGGIRPQWHHAIDIVPTIYEATGVGQPSIVNGVAQKPIEGVSMSYSFDDAKVPSNRRTQYFEMFGLRAIYHDGWVACTTPPTPLGEKADPKEDVVTGYQWELYDTTQDFSEAVNLADKNPTEAGRTAAALLRGGGEVQRDAARQQSHSARGCLDPAKPHPRTQRVHLLRDDGAYPGGRGAGREEQVVPRHGRGDAAEGR